MKKTPVSKGFASQASFRRWLEQHHAKRTELHIRCFKVHARKRGMTYREAVEEALCFGWIDGIGRALDADSFVVRFTPRRPRSKWSQVNRKRMQELEAAGRMTPAGRAAFQAAGQPTAGYSFESRPRTLARKYAQQLEANEKACSYYEQQPPWYRRTSSFWVMSAKQEATRERRLATLIEYCAKGKPIPPLARKKAAS